MGAMASSEHTAADLPVREQSGQSGVFGAESSRTGRPALSLDDALDPVLLTEERLRDVFDHEFTGPDGKQWQTSIAQPVITPSGRDADVSGDVICDGRSVGHFTRKVVLREGGYVKHQDIHLDDDYQGHGFGRIFSTRCAAGYAELGLNRVKMETGSDGLATWPRLGFDLEGSKTEHVPGSDQTFYEANMQWVMHCAHDGLKKITDIATGDRAQAVYDELMSREQLPTLPELVQEHPEWCRLVLHGAKVPLSASPETLIEHSRSIGL